MSLTGYLFEWKSLHKVWYDLHDIAQISPPKPPDPIKSCNSPKLQPWEASSYCWSSIAEKKERWRDKRILVKTKKVRRLISTQIMHNATTLIFLSCPEPQPLTCKLFFFDVQMTVYFINKITQIWNKGKGTKSSHFCSLPSLQLWKDPMKHPGLHAN